MWCSYACWKAQPSLIWLGQCSTPTPNGAVFAKSHYTDPHFTCNCSIAFLIQGPHKTIIADSVQKVRTRNMSNSPPHHEESPAAPSTKGSGHAQTFVVHLNPGIDNPYGFRIYRTSYDSDEDWDQFMAYFKAQARRSLLVNELGRYAHLRDEVDYTVQSSPNLEDITCGEVRT